MYISSEVSEMLRQFSASLFLESWEGVLLLFFLLSQRHSHMLTYSLIWDNEV